MQPKRGFHVRAGTWWSPDLLLWHLLGTDPCGLLVGESQPGSWHSPFLKQHKFWSLDSPQALKDLTILLYCAQLPLFGIGDMWRETSTSFCRSSGCQASPCLSQERGNFCFSAENAEDTQSSPPAKGSEHSLHLSKEAVWPKGGNPRENLGRYGEHVLHFREIGWGLLALVTFPKFFSCATPFHLCTNVAQQEVFIHLQVRKIELKSCLPWTWKCDQECAPLAMVLHSKVWALPWLR